MAESQKDVVELTENALTSVRERGEALTKAADTLRDYIDRVRKAIAQFLYPEEAEATGEDGDFFEALGRLETGKEFLTPEVKVLIGMTERTGESVTLGELVVKVARRIEQERARPSKAPRPPTSAKPGKPATAQKPKPATAPKPAPAPAAASAPKPAPAAASAPKPAPAPAAKPPPPELTDKLARLRGHLLSGYFSKAKLIYNACPVAERKFFDDIILEVTRHYLSNLHATNAIKKMAIERILQLIADYGKSLVNPQGIPISKFRAALDSVKEKLPKNLADAVETTARRSLPVFFKAEGIRSLAPAVPGYGSDDGDDDDDDDEPSAPPADPDENIDATSATIKGFLLEGKYEIAVKQAGGDEEALTKAVLETFGEDLRNLGAGFEADNTSLNTARNLFEFFGNKIGAQRFVIMVAAAHKRLIDKFEAEKGDQLFNLIRIKFPELFPPST